MVKLKKYISIILNIVYIITILLFLLDIHTSFDIKSQALKSFIYYGIIIISPIILIWNLWFFKTRKQKIISLILPLMAIIGILIIGPFKIIFSSSAWKTQTVLYQNKHFKIKKIETQIQDLGALGYNKRTVEVTYLTNFFMIINPVEKNVNNKIEWKKENKQTLNNIISSKILIGKTKKDVINILDTINFKQFNYEDDEWMLIQNKTYKELSTKSPIEVFDIIFENNKVVKIIKR